MGLIRKVLRGVFALLLFSIATVMPVAADDVDDLDLVHAIKRGDSLVELHSLLEDGVNVNAVEADGATALAWASHKDNLEAVNRLIHAGANVDLSNDYGVSPLALACTNRNASIVDALLKAGADPDVSQWTGETPLLICARTGAVEAVQALLSNGASLDVSETQQGHTALMRAVSAHHPEVVRVLLEQGANVSVRSKGGSTALLLASQQGDLESVRQLLAAGADIDEAPLADIDARHDLTGGLCVTTSRYQCWIPRKNATSLIVATASGHEELALFLLENGADPDGVDAYGRTALHHAIPEGWAAIDSYFYRPFHDKTRLPNLPKVVDALLLHGADPNMQIVKDYSPYTRGPYRMRTRAIGATPLAFAAAAGDPALMRRLLDAGADPTLSLQDGTTALMLAAGVGRAQDRRTKREEDGAFEAVRLTVELGLDVNAVNRSGQTALHGAASIGADSIIQFLSAKGANLETPDRRGLTPYGIAAGMAGDEEHADRIYKDTMDLFVSLAGKPLVGKTP
jgi:ankyrin repeat protein